MDITSKKRWQNKLERKIPLLLAIMTASLVMCIASQESANLMIPAFAQQDQDGNTSILLEKMLNSSQTVTREKMAEVQGIGISIPADVIDLYSLALTEKTSALRSLDLGDLESAKAHTLVAMRFFKQATDLANKASNSESLIAPNSKDINERLVELQHDVAHLKTIIDANQLLLATRGDLAEFDNAFAQATLAIFQHNYDDAQKHMSRCESLFDSVNEKIHSEIEKSNQSDRAKAFADNIADRLEDLISEAQDMGLSKENMLELKDARQGILDQLSYTHDLESIIQLADRLIEEESKIQVIIEELHDNVEPIDKTVDEQPVDDGPVDDEPVDDSPPIDEPPTYDPSQFEDEYLQLKNDIAALESKVSEAGLTFPKSDTDEMLSSFKQHAENGEQELAAQAMEELYHYLALIDEVTDSYIDAVAKIASEAEIAEDLQTQVTELNYLRFLPAIEDSLALLSDANSELANVANDNGLSYSSVHSANEHIDLANESVAQAASQLEETRASLEEFIAQVTETLDLIKQEETRADQIEHDLPNILSSLLNDILDILDQARGLLADARQSLEAGELEQAREQLSKASSLLDTAEELLVQLLHLTPL